MGQKLEVEWFNFKTNPPEVGTDFLAYFECDGAYDHIIRSSEDMYFNLNSNNETRSDLITHWMHVPHPTEAK